MPDSPGLEVLFVRLYLDRHIMGRLAADLRGRGYDVLRQAARLYRLVVVRVLSTTSRSIAEPSRLIRFEQVPE